MDDKPNIKFYEKSLGLTPADLLIIELKKPNKPILPKSDLSFRKNSSRHNRSLLTLNNFEEDHFYKDPKVRIKNI
jgi:hypothetical protein